MAARVFKSVILGAPASGKGTISQRVVKNFNLKHISSGDKLRQHIQRKTPIGLEVAKYINSGKLVPDKLMIKFIVSELQQVENESWLLDGFPRTISQAEALWEVQKLDLVLNLVVPYQIIINRVKGRRVHLPSGRVYNEGFNEPKVPGRDNITGEPLVQREDDKPQIVLKRLQEYEKLTTPVIKFYRDKGILEEFHGGTSDVIWYKVLERLTNHIPIHVRPTEEYLD